VFFWKTGTSSLTMTDYQGFTEREYESLATFVGSCGIATRIADASDVTLSSSSGSYAFVLSGSSAGHVAMFRVANGGFEASNSSTFTTATTTPSTPTATSGGADRLALHFFQVHLNTSFTWSVVTEIFDSGGGVNRTLTCAYETVGSGVTTARSATIASSATGAGFVVLMAPASTTEALRPTTGGATTNFETYDHTKIDQDPNDATITDVGLSPVVDP
jgi:hypothetical protein